MYLGYYFIGMVPPYTKEIYPMASNIFFVIAIIFFIMALLEATETKINYSKLKIFRK
jgi:hypothetical protein